MKRSVPIFCLLILLGGFTSMYAQGANDADRIIIRLRTVCNFGQGSYVTIAFDIKSRAGGAEQRVGGYDVVLTYNSSKLIYQGVEQRYQYNYWGTMFRNDPIGASARHNQHAAASPGSALPLLTQPACGGQQCFQSTRDCQGNPLNDGFYEVLRYTFNILPSANGYVDFAYYNILPYRASVQYQLGYEATAIYYSNLLNNGNDSTLTIKDLLIPIELVAFSATPQPDGSVALEWRTDSEISNSGFEIERGDGTWFEKIAFVEGQGTVNTPTEYSYIDRSPFSRRNDHVVFYRLKQIDHDGTTSYSPMASAQIRPMTVGMDAPYPNPVSVNEPTSVPYSLAVDATVDMAVYNALGQRIATLVRNEQMQAGRYSSVWDGRNENGSIAPAGFYFVRFNAAMNGEHYSSTSRIMLAR